MALTSDLREGVIRLRDVFHELARHEGWKPEDYRISMYVNKDWDTFSVELLARRYDEFPKWNNPKWNNIRRHLSHIRVLDFVQQHLGDNYPYSALNLSLKPLDGYASRLGYDPGPTLEQVPDEFLYPDVADIVSDPGSANGV